jgi:phosphate transport system substrate-binding protein
MKLKGVLKDNKGVSEVVAVLVLVAVVIVGAIGVGTIMNGFSNQVASGASSDGISDGASTELLTAGSTTVQPLSECLAKVFMDANKGVRVTVQGGGSGAGITAAGLKVVDLGAASKDVSTTDLAKYPNLQTHKIGGSGVVVIASKGCGVATSVAKASELKAIYNGSANTTAGLTVGKAYQRSEASGTEETFAEYLSLKDSSKQLDSKADGKVGNQGVLDAVAAGTADGTCYIGFVDYGFTVGANVNVLNLTSTTDTLNMAPTSANIIDALKGDATKYPMVRPLNYLSNGAPSILAQKFIGFASAPGDKTSLNTAANCFQQTGYFAVWEI